jgi:glycosyltransferase involved in cell wall biosynthesis
VADLRDGWLFEPPNRETRANRLRRKLEGCMERAVIEQAAAVVTATGPIADDLAVRYPRAAGKVYAVTNGFDAAEFAGLARRRQPDGRFLIVYTGGLSASRQGVSPAGFFAALVNLVRRDPATPVRVQVVGDASSREAALAASLGIAEYISFAPPVPVREAHQHQLDADALLLITAPGQRSVATLKLFDYIGAGQPILALAQDNAAAEIVEGYGLGVTAPPDDPAAIERALADLMAREANGATWPGFTNAQARFERRSLTGELAALFDRVLAAKGGAA